MKNDFSQMVVTTEEESRFKLWIIDVSGKFGGEVTFWNSHSYWGNMGQTSNTPGIVRWMCVPNDGFLLCLADIGYNRDPEGGGARA